MTDRCDRCDPERAARRETARAAFVQWQGHRDVLNGTIATLRMLGRQLDGMLSFSASLAELNQKRAFADDMCERLQRELEALS